MMSEHNTECLFEFLGAVNCVVEVIVFFRSQVVCPSFVQYLGS